MINRIEIDQYLSDIDLNVNIYSKFTRETAAHYCCKNGHKEILKKILSRCPEVANRKDDEGNTLLHSMCLVNNFTNNKVIIELSK